MLVIDPEECIDCGACEPECPVEAIFPEDALPEKWEPFVRINAAFNEGMEASTSSRADTRPSTTSRTSGSTSADRVGSAAERVRAGARVARERRRADLRHDEPAAAVVELVPDRRRLALGLAQRVARRRPDEEQIAPALPSSARRWLSAVAAPSALRRVATAA